MIKVHITNNNIVILNLDYFITNDEFSILEAKCLIHCIIHTVSDKCLSERTIISSSSNQSPLASYLFNSISLFISPNSSLMVARSLIANCI